MPRKKKSQNPPEKKIGDIKAVPLQKRGRHGRRRIQASQVIAAIRGSGGIKQLIADRLGCSWTTVYLCLSREGPGWDRVRTAYRDECERIGDLAEEAIKDCITQRRDLAVASQNARWFLSRRHKERGFGDESKVTVQGGDKPIQVQATKYTLDDLDLPLEVRKEILKAIEKKEALPEDGDDNKAGGS